ncbi:MAG: anthranilate phosphoribosyltransferase, partial [Chloroflexi bacterium]|nr:anthranilate phosphoribosyltransferase [Chloroflexota bacterium]
RTVFNILGPLTNPALVEAQVLGVASANLGEKMVRVLQRLGTKRAIVVHGLNGMDEITVAGKSRVWELRDGEITQYDISPEDFGMTEAAVETLVGGTSEENAAIMRSVLEGEKGPRRDAVVMNAAAGIALVNNAQGIPALKEGVEIAIETIDSGKAMEKLEKLISLSRSYG